MLFRSRTQHNEARAVSRPVVDTCIVARARPFCDRPADSAEHADPQWMSRYYLDRDPGGRPFHDELWWDVSRPNRPCAQSNHSRLPPLQWRVDGGPGGPREASPHRHERWRRPHRRSRWPAGAGAVAAQERRRAGVDNTVELTVARLDTRPAKAGRQARNTRRLDGVCQCACSSARREHVRHPLRRQRAPR